MHLKRWVAACCVWALAACGPEFSPEELEAVAAPEAEGEVIQNEELLLADCTSTIPLANGVAVNNIGAGTAVYSCIYTINVPSGMSRLTITSAGGTGDSDLYVKYGATPSTSVYDCGRYGGGNEATCSFDNPAAGAYHVRLYAFSTFSGVNLTASYANNNTSCTNTYALSNGAPVSSVSAGVGVYSCIYTLNVPAGATNVKFTTSGGTGNADLYVKLGAVPTRENAEHYSFTPGTNTETVPISVPHAGTYYVRMYGVTAASGITLTGSYNHSSCSATSGLTNGIPVSGVSAEAGNWSCIYTLDVPPGASNLRFTTSGGTGAGNLYVKFGAMPSAASYDCANYNSNTTGSCRFDLPRAGRYFVRMYSYLSTPFSGVTLQASYTGGTSGGNVLLNAVPVTNISGNPGSEQVWTIDVPTGRSALNITTTWGSGNADLYVKRGAAPTESVYDCRSNTSYGPESCILNTPLAGKYYVMLKGAGSYSYSGWSLTGQY